MRRYNGQLPDHLIILQNAGLFFTSCLVAAIEFHRNELCDSHILNFMKEEIAINDCLTHHNIEAFFFYS